MLKKTLFALAATAALATTPATAQMWRDGPPPNYVAPAAGVVAGTVVGIGAYEGWWGTTVFNRIWPGATIGGALVTGGVIGIGTAAAVHAVTTPCQGAHMFFGNLFTSSEGCANGRWIGREASYVRPSRRR